MKAGSKRSSALDKLKSRSIVQQVKPAAGRFSAAASHEQNDAYMAEFDRAYDELEAISLSGKKAAAGSSISAHRPHTEATSKRLSRPAKPVAAAPSPLSALECQPAATKQTAYPTEVCSGWRTGPEDPAGRLCNVSDIPLLCSCINWAAGEVIVGSSDHALYAIDILTGQKRRTLFTKTAGHTEWVSACQYLPDGRVISGGMDSMLCVWEANSTRCQPLAAHAAPISAIDVSTALGLAASASYDKSVRLWDVSRSRVTESSNLTGHTAPVLQLSCGSRDSIISGDRGGTVICWGVATQSIATKLKDAHVGHVTALAWQHDPNGLCTDSFFTGGQDGHLRFWDTRSKKCAQDIAAHVNAKGKGAVGNIVAAGPASSNLVITAGADNTVKAYDSRADCTPVSHAKLTDFPYSMAVAGGLALAGCGDGSLLVIDINTGDVLYALGANKAAVRGVHASDKCLVCVGDDGSVYMYDFIEPRPGRH